MLATPTPPKAATAPVLQYLFAVAAGLTAYVSVPAAIGIVHNKPDATPAIVALIFAFLSWATGNGPSRSQAFAWTFGILVAQALLVSAAFVAMALGLHVFGGYW